MTDFLSQPQHLQHPALDRRQTDLRITVIEDTVQVSVQKRMPPSRMQAKRGVISPMTDDFPTPRAFIAPRASSPARSVSDSSVSDAEVQPRSMSIRAGPEFDEMYDVSGSESEEVPLKLSSSIKQRLNKNKKLESGRYPSLVIPSPRQWPTIEKLKSATALSPSFTMQLSPAILSRLQTKHIPSTSSTPSLDGSLTSEELASSSCPSTPDIHQQPDSETWEVPIQLDPSSISLLQQINIDDNEPHLETVIEIPEEAMAEMQEIVSSPPITGAFKIETNITSPSTNDADDELLSALSVPSPGGFFASLDSSVARKTWAGNELGPNTSTATEFYGVPFRSSMPDNLPTSTATSFYNVPWQTRPDNAVEHVITVASSVNTQDPVTARKIVLSPTDVITEVDEIDEHYDDTLKQTAAANMDRTQMWLSMQTEYMQAICEEDDLLQDFEHIEGAVPTLDNSPVAQVTSPASARSSPAKKSVRFAGEKPGDDASIVKKRISPIHDGTFWEGWQHMKRSQRARDVFQHRQARAEADQIKRVSLQKQHANQLSGRFEISDVSLPSSTRPVSSLLPDETEDERSVVIARADRERQALDQMQSSSWHIEAQREVNGGRLLTSPITRGFRGRKDARILDLAGQVRCSWAWAVAADHPNAAVYTTVSSDAEAHVAESCHEGPANHFVVASPHLWELPFEDNYFDVVSCRTLYTVLRTVWPKGHAADEWDLTLRECFRVLRPGGYLEFDLLDAELAHADPLAQALGVEFSYNLKMRGYDPVAGKTFLPRLKRAGFHDIKRAWMVLPMADSAPHWSDLGDGAALPDRAIAGDGTVSAFRPPVTGSTKDVRAMTGLVGARMWEQWMMKLNGEMGRSESRCLDDVAKVLEEGGKGSAGWRCLVGWARKGSF